MRFFFSMLASYTWTGLNSYQLDFTVFRILFAGRRYGLSNESVLGVLVGIPPFEGVSLGCRSWGWISSSSMSPTAGKYGNAGDSLTSTVLKEKKYFKEESLSMVVTKLFHDIMFPLMKTSQSTHQSSLVNMTDNFIIFLKALSSFLQK